MTVLLVEDDPLVLLGADQALSLAGMTVITACDAETALRLLTTSTPDAVVSDIRLPGADGFELLRRVRELDHEVPVILMTGHGDIRMAVDAMHNGAYDFLEKPFSSDRLTEVVRRALEKRHLVLENRRLQALVGAQSVSDLIGQAPAIVEAKRRINALGPTQVDILIRGETGTGKEVVARALHKASGRRGPFVAINCGALPESIFESEMFGHEAGAFTGAARKRIGKLEYARGGTVFLDEIESLPLSQQVKMLRVLQERRLERLGGNELVAIDCRFIAATKEDLKTLSEQGTFRADLFYRLNVAHISLPPVRERREDIPLLMAHCVRAAADRYGVNPPSLSQLQLATWQGQDWPGNVRELKNVADRLCLGLEGDAASTLANENDSPAMALQIEAFEKHLIVQALTAHGGNVTLAAEHLKLPRKTLYDKVARYAIDTSVYRSPA
ncbi:sigma-54 dependent transcriptional regulator [Rhodoferax sp. PAMC 29310]|uniref:sigma-54-dependent transcriptional regulator n=1 Tax=Rhodoferax sp. PAMC 29310 TaxID=2822760 RepID=UPI001F0A8DB0|nr:sigma-54 dependent transcriptional regulator [Rhodoferax sp. PAMC 29310]